EVAGRAVGGGCRRAAQGRRIHADRRRGDPGGPGAGKGRQFLSTVALPREAHPHAVHAAPTSFWRKYIFSLDHKVIGKQYLLYALFMLMIGGLLAMLVPWRREWRGKPIAFMGK